MRNVHEETLSELREIAEKGTDHLRKRTRYYTPVSPTKDYQPHEIKAIREKNQYSQSFFGEFLGVSLKTVQAWEAGTNKPTGTARRIFQVLEQDPNALDKYLLA
ncbi:MAG: helix-turn-helix domain-containing protein [Defluviitaleaceae bacterium]|nr:helix-turn-helix domain-containing protein [Defluviitaleaceae bacterium]